MVRTSLLSAASALALLIAASAAHAVPATGLAGSNSLFSFDTASPSTIGASVLITGLQANETIYGIDYRPATGALYGLGTSGRLYTLNTATGAATQASVLGIALRGASFDIAFNPVVDRLRIVSNLGQNLRINVDTGAPTGVGPTPNEDGGLAFVAGDPNAGTTANVTAVAYTNQRANNFGGATTLYDLETQADVLAIQNPPNNGGLATTGALGVGDLLSFDIDGVSGAAFAANSGILYSINLATGAASVIGSLGRSNVSDFALTPVPEPISLAMLGVGIAGLAVLRRRRADTLA